MLSEHFTCYLLDSRGHGQSTPVSTLSYTTMAEDVIAFADSLALKKPTLYGFSDGGIIGLMVAMRRPELLSRLIVSGANLNPLGVKLKTYLELRIATIFNKDPKLLLMVREPQIKPHALSAIRVPTLVLAGKGDLIRETHTRQIAANIPGAELQLL